MKNNKFLKTGFLKSEIKKEDYVFGGETKLSSKVVKTNGQWLEYLPKNEVQHAIERWKFDSLGCVSFSLLNCLEIQYLFKYGIQKNYSDKFLTVSSDTTIYGNTGEKVAEAFRKKGVVLEEAYPFVAKDQDGDGDYDRADFFKEIPNDIKLKAKEWLEENDFYHEWINIGLEDLKKEALKLAPLQIYIRYASQSKADSSGVIQWDGKSVDHATTLVGYEYGKFWYIFDTYSPFLKKIAWDYPILQWAKRFEVISKNAEPVNILEKYQGKLIRNADKPEHYFVGKTTIAHIKNEESFKFGRENGFWGDWSDTIVIDQEIKPNLEF